MYQYPRLCVASVNTIFYKVYPLRGWTHLPEKLSLTSEQLLLICASVREGYHAAYYRGHRVRATPENIPNSDSK
jgi:hypothetical protein